jgi:hypothetical protein
VTVTTHRIYNQAVAEQPTPEARRLLTDPATQLCMNFRTLDEFTCCYGADNEHCQRALAQARRANAVPDPKKENEMCANCQANATRVRELEQLAAEGTKTLRRVNRLAVTGDVDAAIADGRIALDDRDRWLERGERNLESTREVLAELRPEVGLAHANAIPRLTAEQASYAERELAASLGVGVGALI